jgi:hypothetical protein
LSLLGSSLLFFLLSCLIFFGLAFSFFSRGLFFRFAVLLLLLLPLAMMEVSSVYEVSAIEANLLFPRSFLRRPLLLSSQLLRLLPLLLGQLLPLFFSKLQPLLLFLQPLRLPSKPFLFLPFPLLFFNRVQLGFQSGFFSSFLGVLLGLLFLFGRFLLPVNEAE